MRIRVYRVSDKPRNWPEQGPGDTRDFVFTIDPQLNS